MGHQMGESKSWSCARVFELCIVDEIKKGVFIFLRLFIGDSDMPLKILSFLISSFVDVCGMGGVRTWLNFAGPYSCRFCRTWRA